MLPDCPDKFVDTHETVVCKACLENPPDSLHRIEVGSVFRKPKQMYSGVGFQPLPHGLGFVSSVVVQDNKYRPCGYLTIQGFGERDEVLGRPSLEYECIRSPVLGLRAPYTVTRSLVTGVRISFRISCNGPVKLDTERVDLKYNRAMKKTYSPSFKAQVVLELLGEEKEIAQISSEYGVHPSQLHKWKRQALEGLPSVSSDDNRAIEPANSEYEAKMKELYAEIGRLSTYVEWFKKGL